mgnify:CR=1 FL=1
MEFFGDSIAVGKPKNLNDIELKSITEFMEKLLSSERIGTVSVGNETEIFGKFFKVPKGHAHRHDAGTDTAIIRYICR